MNASEPPAEVGEAIIERLGEHGVDYLFATFGTDHPPIIKGLARGGGPSLILAPHEMLAASAAQAYAQVTGEPQAVLVHVDVGTANLGPSLHNAARTRVPMFVMAGRTPLTTRGELPGSRSIFVHWYQDVYDQHGLVREYTKWEYELETAANVDRVVDRGLDVARSSPAGPVYLSLPRETLRSEYESPDEPIPTGSPTAGPTTLAEGTRGDLLGLLEDATHPLLVTSYLGRDEPAVAVLREFAETTGVPVVEPFPAFDLNFPRDHPLHLGFTPERYLDDVDLLLVANCDVPWIPPRAMPSEEATVVHVDPDPEKSQYPMWDFPADLRVRADPAPVLADLADGFDAPAVVDRRLERFGHEHDALRREWRSDVPDPADADHVTPALLSRAVGEAIDPETVVVDETVTNTLPVLRHLDRTVPGSYYSYCSSGLGWGLGGAIGVKLARPEATVVALVGDGSFLLGNPMAAIQMIEAYDLAHVTVVYNNGGWNAVEEAIRDQYGDAPFANQRFTRFGTDLDYAGTAAGMGCHGERVADPAELQGALDRALTAAADGTHAVVDVRIQS